MNNTFVINIGGSILSPSDDVLFDFEKAKQVKELISKFPDKKFILCVGGGSITRKYQQLLKDNGYEGVSEHDVGVAVINVNAVMLKAALKDISEERVLRYEDFNNDNPINFSKQVLVSAAGAPGHSSDWNTIKLAIRSGESKVFSLTNIDAVYDRDPRIYADAVKKDRLNWKEYLDIIGNPTEHKPGAKYPVDPSASKLSIENNIEFYVLNGNDLGNFEKALRGESFTGTLISNK
jgi:uridylate kinase